MSALGAIRDALADGPDCATCRHFCDDPGRIEAELPGLAALSSSHAAVRARDGLCLAHGLVINGGRRCAAFQNFARSSAPT